jgi:hypothetical protein
MTPESARHRAEYVFGLQLPADACRRAHRVSVCFKRELPFRERRGREQHVPPQFRVTVIQVQTCA